MPKSSDYIHILHSCVHVILTIMWKEKKLVKLGILVCHRQGVLFTFIYYLIKIEDVGTPSSRIVFQKLWFYPRESFMSIIVQVQKIKICSTKDTQIRNSINGVSFVLYDNVELKIKRKRKFKINLITDELNHPKLHMNELNDIWYLSKDEDNFVVNSLCHI